MTVHGLQTFVGNSQKSDDCAVYSGRLTRDDERRSDARGKRRTWKSRAGDVNGVREVNSGKQFMSGSSFIGKISQALRKVSLGPALPDHSAVRSKGISGVVAHRAGGLRPSYYPFGYSMPYGPD
jgi:hypothetical protein